MRKPVVEIVDCLVVGGGPAGLVAATYLGRFRRQTLVVDAGNSRALLIPESHNYPGFMGVSGPALLTRLREQAGQYGARIAQGQVAKLQKENSHFTATLAGGTEVRARAVILCTGLEDHKPDIEASLSESLERVRYCPICDGYEGTDQRLGIVGNGKAALQKAIFMRTYTKDVYLFADDYQTLPDQLRAEADRLGIKHRSLPEKITAHDHRVNVIAESGATSLDAIYPALGCHIRSELAAALGARIAEEGSIIVNGAQQTSVEKLYAAGDVVTDINQLAVAAGHAAIAATSIHKVLALNPR